ncbi:hypothetical protein FH972_021732 [Carpinus fangiana]|uniref:AB hydrolase-1 domain-containing protein n=1 Tax=Carpinus fangiana TaxID=176857 RepID=A0A5N6KQI8_9ROSI|nr:hypothetical protein FH972_021732 [Carpinus fangiana]
MIVHRNLTVQGNTNVFYREAGQPSKPTVLLLHGFPTSSFQYRNLIPLLARNYHIIAPDLPGFGFTVTPPDYVYTFATLAETIAAFLQKLQLDHMAVYMFDYGAPIALRLATQHNVRFDAIISQNGNAYVEGFAHPFWDSTMRLWQTNSAADRDALQADAISLEAYKGQYETGVSQKAIGFIDPATNTLERAKYHF